jgi:hypothetical protein
MWCVCRPDGDLTVSSWVSASVSEFVSCENIVRVELFSNGDMVVSELVANCSGVVRPDARYEATKDIQFGYLSAKLMSHRDFSTYQEAYDEVSRTAIPADGVLIVNVTGSSIFRIKEPTIDLIVSQGRLISLKSEDRRSMFSMPAMPGMRERSVNERTSEPHDGSARVKRHVPRPDKLSPNRYDVVMSTIYRTLGRSMDAEVIAQKVTSISYTCRQMVHSRAASGLSAKGLIVDVGSGRLQSWSIVTGMSQRLLFCDPQLDMGYIPIWGRGAFLAKILCMHLTLISSRESSGLSISIIRIVVCVLWNELCRKSRLTVNHPLNAGANLVSRDLT